MTNTPETDELRDDIWASVYVEGQDFMQMLEHARKLERQRDKLAEVLQSIRSGYGGQMTDPDCNCDDCKFLINMDAALQYLTQKEL
jgi:hypothetical protein